MTKFTLICILALTAAACQNKPGNRPEEEIAPAPKVAPNAVVASTKFASNCTGKYTTKIYKEDGSTELKNFETISRAESISTFVKKESDLNTYQVTGSYFYEEALVADDGSKKLESNSDYTFSGTRTGKTLEVSENTYSRTSIKEYVKTGRNGFKFRNKDKQMVDKIESKSTEILVYFDDGQTLYTVSHEINGKNILLNNFDILTQYTESKEGNKVTTVAKSTLKNPFVIKDSEGKILEETTEFEENCTDEQVSSK
jgi:hypothetical protein